MIELLGFFFLFAACYCGFKAADAYQLFRYGIHTTATVSAVEETVEIDEDTHEKFIKYWLILDLPEFMGVKLRKKYATQIAPSQYKVGDMVEIIQNPNAPTEILVKKEMNQMETPTNYLLLTITLLLLSAVMCYGGAKE